ncbi:MAG: hypothetical protein IIA44_07540 [Acidobacteria bacterium]|nr:hypothetical protein [Acidobacteriota bacterium]
MGTISELWAGVPTPWECYDMLGTSGLVIDAGYPESKRLFGSSTFGKAMTR